MKRKGFTLAEILITLGIVGVVAALTAPALVKNTAGAKVGPTLAKVVNTMEVANEELMLDKNISNLKKVYGQNIGTYFADLSKYIRKSAYNSTKRITVYYYNATHNPSSAFNYFTGEFLLPEGASIYTVMATSYIPHDADDVIFSVGSYYGAWSVFFVDINGSQSGNNMLGDDVFGFVLDGSGAMIPIGSQAARHFGGTVGGNWVNNCDANGVGDGLECAGSIFENNLKIIYQ